MTLKFVEPHVLASYKKASIEWGAIAVQCINELDKAFVEPHVLGFLREERAIAVQCSVVKCIRNKRFVCM